VGRNWNLSWMTRKMKMVVIRQMHGHDDSIKHVWRDADSVYRDKQRSISEFIWTLFSSVASQSGLLLEQLFRITSCYVEAFFCWLEHLRKEFLISARPVKSRRTGVHRMRLGSTSCKDEACVLYSALPLTGYI
jgi:hypothetical protein